MAILHQATLKPTKLELLQSFLPTISGLDLAHGTELDLLGAYRFDDPAGAVGIETHLLSTSDGRTIHLPLTYRSAPLTEAEDWFVGTMEHSALGTRWVYDGVGDPVYVAALVRAILTGGTEAKLEVITEDGMVERPNTVHVRGSGRQGHGAAEVPSSPAKRSGTNTIITCETTTVVVHHVPNASSTSTEPHLTGTWGGVVEPMILATTSPS